MKIIVAGSRGFNNYALLREKLDYYLSQVPYPEIVSGTARGADQLGEQYAKERGLAVHRFPADWDRYGKRGGYMRNEDMAKFADCLVAFWDQVSPGTKHMIDLAHKHGLMVRVVHY